jgi:hypothetical protein
MTTLLQDESLPAGGRSREEIAHREIGVTAISPATTFTLVVVFLLLIFTIPVIELVDGRRRSAAGLSTTWSHLTGIPSAVRMRVGEASSGPDVTAWRQTVAVNRAVLAGLQEFERGLEQESRLGQMLRPHTQLVLTRWLGGGNERVYPGREGWLFYRQDVEYVTSPGFLEPRQIARRIAATPEWSEPPQPDPRPALKLFKRDLDARGITLVVMPTPVKPTTHPEMLAWRRSGAPPVQNASYASFVAELDRAGVIVFDAAGALAANSRSSPQYVATDTHWRPEAMEAVAEQLASFVIARVRLPPVPEPGYRLERTEVRFPGDIARMLDLPRGVLLFPPNHVWPTRVLHPDGSTWRPSRDADVLVLGDSFSNIYSLASVGAGSSAGLVEHLSYILQRPIDRLVQNGDGAFATRTQLQQDSSRLAGKRVVVYQFATRELTFGDWRLLPLPPS